MTDDHWFDFLLAVGQTAVGVAVTVLAVYLAATTALRHDRRRAVTERSRQSAEKILAVTESVVERLVLIYGHVNFVFQPTPERIDDPRLVQDFGLPEVVKSIVDDVTGLRFDSGLLADTELRQQFDWALKCALDLHLMVLAATQQPQRLTVAEIAENADHASAFLGEYGNSLRAYLMDAERSPVSKPTHLRTPVKDNL